MRLGLHEKRTRIVCLGTHAFCGAKWWEKNPPDVAQALWEVAERSAQQDPTFRTTLSFTRLEMIMNVKLTATQTKVIKAAAVHPHGNIEPLPANLRGGAKAAVINGLLARDLISKFHVQRSFRAPHMVSNAFLRRRQCLAPLRV